MFPLVRVLSWQQKDKLEQIVSEFNEITSSFPKVKSELGTAFPSKKFIVKNRNIINSLKQLLVKNDLLNWIKSTYLQVDDNDDGTHDL